MKECTIVNIGSSQAKLSITWTSQSWSKLLVTKVTIVEPITIFINKGQYSSSTCFNGLNILIYQVFVFQDSLLPFVSMIWASLMNFRWHFGDLQKKIVNGSQQVL